MLFQSTGFILPNNKTGPKSPYSTRRKQKRNQEEKNPFKSDANHWQNSADYNHVKIDWKKTFSSRDVCYNGIPISIKSCVCFFGPYGVDCITSGVNLENIPWTNLNNDIHPHYTAAKNCNMIDNQFVVAITGRQSADLQLSYFSTNCNNPTSVYRFSASPTAAGGRSRVELTSCFVHEDELRDLFGSSTLDPSVGTSLITYCKAANIPSESLSTFKYELYLPRLEFSNLNSFIITQWHGTPDPNFLRDKLGCVARTRDRDRFNVCNKYKCKKGSIFDELGLPLPVQYQAGGYPPLSVHVTDSFFLVVARSDQRRFIPGGGCPLFRNHSTQRCPDHPSQQVHFLLKLPFDDFPFDSWAKFVWKIKWSQYTWKKSNSSDGGQLTSNAWIRLWLNGKQLIDWVGPCGRNDDGRVPFFKAGIYNPAGSLHPVKFYMKRYEHDFQLISDITDPLERDKLSSLQIQKPEKKTFPNVNHYVSNKGFQKVSGSCKLKLKIGHLADLRRINLSRLDVDEHTKHLLDTLIKILKKQDSRITNLEEKLKACRKKALNDNP